MRKVDEEYEGSVPRLSASTDNYEFVLNIGTKELAWVCKTPRLQSLAELAYRKQEPLVRVTVRDRHDVIAVAVPYKIKKAAPLAARKHKNVAVLGFTATLNRCDIVVEYEKGKRATVIAEAPHIQRMLEISYETKRKLMFIVVEQTGLVVAANLSRPAPKGHASAELPDEIHRPCLRARYFICRGGPRRRRGLAAVARAAGQWRGRGGSVAAAGVEQQRERRLESASSRPRA